MIVDDDNTASGARSEASHRRFTLINRSPGSAQNAKARAKKSAQEVAKGGAQRVLSCLSAERSQFKGRKRRIVGRLNRLSWPPAYKLWKTKRLPSGSLLIIGAEGGT